MKPLNVQRIFKRTRNRNLYDNKRMSTDLSTDILYTFFSICFLSWVRPLGIQYSWLPLRIHLHHFHVSDLIHLRSTHFSILPIIGYPPPLVIVSFLIPITL